MTTTLHRANKDDILAWIKTAQDTTKSTRGGAHVHVPGFVEFMEKRYPDGVDSRLDNVALPSGHHFSNIDMIPSAIVDMGGLIFHRAVFEDSHYYILNLANADLPKVVFRNVEGNVDLAGANLVAANFTGVAPAVLDRWNIENAVVVGATFPKEFTSDILKEKGAIASVDQLIAKINAFASEMEGKAPSVDDIAQARQFHRAKETIMNNRTGLHVNKPAIEQLQSATRLMARLDKAFEAPSARRGY